MNEHAEIAVLAAIIFILAVTRLVEVWETYRRKYGHWLLFDGFRQRLQRRHQ